MNKWPTNQLPVRQAISAAIDRTVLASEAEAGLENPVLNATGLTTPLYDAWSAPVASMTVSAHADAASAKQILQKAGYTMGSNGFFAKGGKTVSLTIVDPSAYTDYAEVDSIVAQELRAAGIDATFQGLSVDAWNSDVADGNFQLTSHWSNSGVTPYNWSNSGVTPYNWSNSGVTPDNWSNSGGTPYNMYDGWLDSSLATGNSATGDYERLNNPSVNAMLATLAGAETTAQQTAARYRRGSRT
jgi:peptide/nickel transport system substrate-binding protein